MAKTQKEINAQYRSTPSLCGCNKRIGVKRTGGYWVCAVCLEKEKMGRLIRQRVEKEKKKDELYTEDVEVFWAERWKGSPIKVGDSLLYLDKLLKQAQNEVLECFQHAQEGCKCQACESYRKAESVIDADTSHDCDVAVVPGKPSTGL